jgi:hypothetical protein
VSVWLWTVISALRLRTTCGRPRSDAYDPRCAVSAIQSKIGRQDGGSSDGLRENRRRSSAGCYTVRLFIWSFTHWRFSKSGLLRRWRQRNPASEACAHSTHGSTCVDENTVATFSGSP